MKLTIHPAPMTTLEVDAEPTNHPELAIHQLDVREFKGPEDANTVVPVMGKHLGKVWAVTHIPSGELIIYGLLTKDLAIATADMLTATGLQFGPGFTKPHLLGSYLAAATLMADCYFAAFYKTEQGRLAVA
jgi:hypothetical protein